MLDLRRRLGFLAKRLRPKKPRARSIQEIHSFWRNPSDRNIPENYLRVGEGRSTFLVGVVRKYAKENASILEIGCNAGRNLAHLFDAGFENLHGIELNGSAVDLLKSTRPDMAARISIHIGAVEDVIRTFRDRQFDVVCTMAVLLHIHPESEWVFKEIARISKTLVMIEDERTKTWRHFPRAYKAIFENSGMNQVAEQVGVPELDSYTLRVFQH